MTPKKKPETSKTVVESAGKNVKLSATVTNVNRVGEPESTNQDVELSVRAGATSDETLANALEQLKEKANAIPAGCHCYNIRVTGPGIAMNRSPKFNDEEGNPEKGTLVEAIDFLVAELRKPRKKARKAE